MDIYDNLKDLPIDGKIIDLELMFPGLSKLNPPKDPFVKEDSKEETETSAEEITETEKLSQKLLEKAKNLIPGLDLDSILENLAEKCPALQGAMEGIQASIEAIKENKRISPEEKLQRLEKLKETRKQQIQAWKDSQKEVVLKTINDIKAEFEGIKFGIENMTTMIPIIISQIALPTFIGTGSPNPARILADGVAYKRMLQSMAKPIEVSCSKLLNACKMIKFDLPAPVLKIVESVSKLTEMINQIPG